MSKLAVMYALYKDWTEMILSGLKPLEFRTQLPNKLAIGTKIYLYETKKRGGAGAVVGECTVKSIINVLSDKGQWPIVGCYPFIEYYLRNIKKDNAAADHFCKINNEFKDNKRYRWGFITPYIYSDIQLDHLRRTGELPDLFDYNPMTQKDMDKLNKIFADKEKGSALEHECDDWLTKIGFYNEYDETNYKYALELGDIIRYDAPKSISQFIRQDGSTMKDPPQSFCYTLERSWSNDQH